MSTVDLEPQTANGAVEPDAEAVSRSTKDDWLTGAGDREEVDLEVPGMGATVRIKALSAGMSASIQSAAMSMKGDSMTTDLRRRQVLTFAEGVIEPKFTAAEVDQVAERWGAAFRFVVDAIDEISASDPKALERFRQRFRPRR